MSLHPPTRLCFSLTTHTFPLPYAFPLITIGVSLFLICPQIVARRTSSPALNVALVAWMLVALIVIVIVHPKQLLAERAGLKGGMLTRQLVPTASLALCPSHSPPQSTRPTSALQRQLPHSMRGRICVLLHSPPSLPVLIASHPPSSPHHLSLSGTRHAISGISTTSLPSQWTIDNRTDIVDVEKALRNNRVEDIQGDLGWDEQVDDEGESGRMEWLKDVDVDGLTRFLSELQTPQKISPFSSLSLSSLPGAFFSLWNKPPITGSSFRSR
ncbi:hypothetical protein BLNAU_12042 [Blattamonas nauphoetae]|uniref:Uncharacterized protein n=1 Tax=Blattamonas nauphoetae TaxID=2049346 RepID=A0ABQ9XKV5_9EUKA|nr:hypothetical protein BLNAU_12042 [Blattamonas nauphoetae]